MINRLVFLFSLCFLMAGCAKSDSGSSCSYSISAVVVPASEMSVLQAYVAASRPAAILDPGGFYYEVIAGGTGTVTPSVCTAVTVKYAGYLTNGFKFDEAVLPVQFALGGLIVGWQRGLPLIKAGGSINLYLPPSLGYGASGTNTIPGNAITIFTIDLVGVL
ncbi:MAG: FKBP-type peptidyl-prolyl cis-trans isomerase [Chitinophagaceae bacterium]|nr:FKBP-type peptidyl-prolyl cis-trans isomerase [Chitinophagaceae bacterium]